MDRTRLPLFGVIGSRRLDFPRCVICEPTTRVGLESRFRVCDRPAPSDDPAPAGIIPIGPVYLMRHQELREHELPFWPGVIAAELREAGLEVIIADNNVHVDDLSASVFFAATLEAGLLSHGTLRVDRMGVIEFRSTSDVHPVGVGKITATRAGDNYFVDMEVTLAGLDELPQRQIRRAIVANIVSVTSYPRSQPRRPAAGQTPAIVVVREPGCGTLPSFESSLGTELMAASRMYTVVSAKWTSNGTTGSLVPSPTPVSAAVILTIDGTHHRILAEKTRIAYTVPGMPAIPILFDVLQPKHMPSPVVPSGVHVMQLSEDGTVGAAGQPGSPYKAIVAAVLTMITGR